MDMDGLTTPAARLAGAVIFRLRGSRSGTPKTVDLAC